MTFMMTSQMMTEVIFVIFFCQDLFDTVNTVYVQNFM